MRRNPFLYDADVRAEHRRRRLRQAGRTVWARRALAVALAAGAAGGIAVALTHRSNTVFSRGRVRFQPCAVELVAAECARVAVPEDPRRPDGRRISLHVALIPAAHHPVLGALFYLEGGPGGAASAAVPTVGDLLGEVGRARDLVLVDQRGTGASRALACPAARVAVEDASAVDAYVSACFARLGKEARLLTTAAAADDLEAVRRALGYGAIDLYGASYGATAAQVFLRLHPGSVRTMTLDSGSLLGVRVYEASPANAETALRRQLARCARSRACRRDYPRTRAQLAALLRRGPRQTSAYGRRVTLDADAVAATVHALSLAPDGVPLVPQVVAHAARGDYVPMAQEYVDRVGPLLDARARLATTFEILCSEPWARQSAAAIRRLGRGSYLAGLAEARARLFAGACRSVPPGFVPPGSTRLVPTDVPTLLLAGADDPQDPPANLRGWRRLFRRGRLVVVPGATHGVLDRGCVSQLVARFVARGTARGLETGCVRRIAPAPFVLG